MNRKPGALLGVLASAGSLLLLTPGSAAASEDGGGRAFGTASTDIFSTSFDVRQHSSDPHDFSGFVHARPNVPILHDAVLSTGRITCLRIEGNQVGVVYLLDDTSEPAAFRGQAIFATAQDNGPGHRDLAGFVGGPPSLFPDCHPTPSIMRVTAGDITVQPD